MEKKGYQIVYNDNSTYTLDANGYTTQYFDGYCSSVKIEMKNNITKSVVYKDSNHGCFALFAPNFWQKRIRDVLKKLPLGNASVKNKLGELLAESDFVTLHVPETSSTQNMISAREFKQMKRGSFLINASRGTVVVIEDLVEALKTNHIAGCAVDVFPIEPASNKEKFTSFNKK